MTRLLDLLHSLTAVIIRYHDSNAEKKLIANVTELEKRSLELSPMLLAQEDYQANLNKLIAQCTNEYKNRKSLLDYIAHEISFIKSMLDRNSSCNELELDQLKQQITQLFLDFKQLISTSKSEAYKVTYSKLSTEAPTTISISGLKKNLYLGSNFFYGGLCCSGDLINLVLERFNISNTSSNQEIKELAENMCQELQNSLLVPELEQAKNELGIALKKEEEKAAPLSKALEEKVLQHSLLVLELEQAKNELRIEKENVARLSKKLADKELESELSKIERTPEESAATQTALIPGEIITTSGPLPQASPNNASTLKPFSHALFGLGGGLGFLAYRKLAQQGQETTATTPDWSRLI